MLREANEKHAKATTALAAEHKLKLDDQKQKLQRKVKTPDTNSPATSPAPGKDILDKIARLEKTCAEQKAANDDHAGKLKQVNELTRLQADKLKAAQEEVKTLEATLKQYKPTPLGRSEHSSFN